MCRFFSKLRPDSPAGERGPKLRLRLGRDAMQMNGVLVLLGLAPWLAPDRWSNPLFIHSRAADEDETCAT